MRNLKAAAGLCCLLLGSSPLATAQDTRGRIIGRVADPSGAVVAGAKVTGLHLETGVKAAAVTNSTGDYILPFLISGTYSVTVERDGFRRFTQTGIEVQVEELPLNVTLQLGSAAQEVTVSADASMLETADASVSTTVGEKSITELPLKDGNPLMLVELSPGVLNLASGGMTRSFDNGNTSSMVINGSRTGTNEYRLDGAPNTSGSSGNVAYIPPSGVVSEVRVQTNPFDAAAGFSTGGTINVTLKSGTSRIHGQLYSFIQNPALNANAYFSNLAGLPKDNYRQNRWGVIGSGPVVLPKLYNGRNRTFWMYGYEGVRDSLPHPGDSGAVTLPTAPERQGDFSALLNQGSKYQIFDPATGVPSGTHVSRSPFPNNLIPASRIDPNAVAILNRFYPAGNLPGAADGTNNYVASLVEKNQFMSHIFRIDHAVSDRNRLFLRGSYNNRYQDYERRYNDAAGYNYWRNNRGAGIDDTYIINPQFFVNLRYNYTRYIEATDPRLLGLDITTLGFSKNFAGQAQSIDPLAAGLPDIAISGLPELNAVSRSRSSNDIHAFAAAFTKTRSSHTFTFGGEWRIYRDNSANEGRSSGNEQFGTTYTKGPLDNAASSPFGQGVASFLLGLPTAGYIDRNANYAQQYQISGWYLQDAWKVTSSLTVSLGMRWEIEIPTIERYDRAIRGFDFNAVSPIAAQAQAAYALHPIPQIAPADFKVMGGLTFVGVNGQPRNLWDGNPHDFEPRAAVAWRFANNTVLRAGYGIFYDIARQAVDQTGFSQQTPLNPTTNNGLSFISSLENPFPNGLLSAPGSSLGLMTNAGQNVNPKYTHLLDPYVQRWQLSLQRTLGRNTLFEVAYVGNRATHLRVTRNNVDSVPYQYLSMLPYRDNALNTLLTSSVPNPYLGLLPASTSLGSSTTVQVQQLLRPYSQFTGGSTTSNEGFSWYHSLQTRVEKRFSGGFLLTGAWTWSKFMEANSFLNNTDPAPTHAISDQDRTQRLVISSVYELPVGAGKLFLGGTHGLFGKVVSGWQINGVYQLQSGPPLGFGDIPFNGNVNNIPLATDQRSIYRWFNTDAGFDKNSADAFVYHVRTFPARLSGLRGMGLNWLDLSASKTTRISERFSLQFRAEFINALNHPHFSTPQMDPTNAAFGQVTSTAQQPRNIQFGLRLVF